MIEEDSEIYLKGLAYLLGIEGAAVLRALWDGPAPREFIEARLEETRRLLATPELVDAEAVTVIRRGHSTAELYRSWAATYDCPGNEMIDVEQPRIRRIIDLLPIGTVLDAACGTGRHTSYLAQLGHEVIGIDSSKEMLAVARNRLPGIEFYEADLHAIPLVDHSVDAVICTLALTYVSDLSTALAEFARVLRPGGDLVISDAHLMDSPENGPFSPWRGPRFSSPAMAHGGIPDSYIRPKIALRVRPDGRPSTLPQNQRLLSDYLAAALPLGSRVRHCEEPRRPRAPSRKPLPTADLPTDVSWEVLDWCPEATATVFGDWPLLVICHFQLAEDAA